MFDVGFWELVLIFGVGLMILGPERMPRVAAQIGRWVGRARRTASQLRRQLQRELELDEFMNQRRPPPTPPKPPPNQPVSEGKAATVHDSAAAGSAPGPDASTAEPSPPGGATGGEDGRDETGAEENRIASPDQVSEPPAAEAPEEESAKSP